MFWIYEILNSLNPFKKKSGRLDFARRLLQLRIDTLLKEDEKMAFEATLENGDEVELWPDIIVEGMPETTIVTIVEGYCLAKKRDLDDWEIFQSIEFMRSSYDTMPNPNPMPSNPNLKNYIYYRLEYELEYESNLKIGEMGFTRDFIDKAIDASLNFYS